ncbi:DUF2892 domain-containing protein [Alteromonadaceae bacterium M269]|nr:DUF2892 domain-containing protein [Alteromonadaceae bacterium M269]
MALEKDNVGLADSALRALASVILISVGIEGILPMVLSVIMAVWGTFLFLTAATGECMVYRVLNIDTSEGRHDCHK